MFSPIPYRHIVIRTSLTAEKAASIVASAVGSRRVARSVFGWLRPEPPGFEGEVSDDRFKIERSYSPWSRQIRSVVYGRFSSLSHRTDIDIRITVSPLTFCPLIIIFVALISEMASYLKGWITSGSLDPELGFIMLFILFGYAIVTVTFNQQADLAEEFIEGVFHRFRIPSR